MKKLTALLAGLFFILVSAVAAAPGDSAEDYIIGPRDVLFVNVWGEANMEEKVEVDVDGTIPFFYVGKVKVAGLSVSQARDRLVSTLANGYIRNPVVILKVEEYRSKEVQIQGAVANPGTYVLTTNTTTLLKIIAMAGGTNENRGNRATITRGEVGRQIERPKPAPAPAAGNTASPAPGDTAFGWSDPKPACGATASPTPSAPPAKAEPAKTLPVNASGQIVIDLSALLDHGDLSQDVTIYPGDIILVSNIKAGNRDLYYVFVGGAVKNPDQIEFAPGMTALQAVILAGGFTEVASPNRTTITRLGPNNTTITIKVPLRDIQRGRKPDVLLQSGDRINVPESVF